MTELDTVTVSLPEIFPPGYEPVGPPVDFFLPGALAVFWRRPRKRRVTRSGAGGGDPPSSPLAAAGSLHS